jgi:hypothetical protein
MRDDCQGVENHCRAVWKLPGADLWRCVTYWGGRGRKRNREFGSGCREIDLGVSGRECNKEEWDEMDRNGVGGDERGMKRCAVHTPCSK